MTDRNTCILRGVERYVRKAEEELERLAIVPRRPHRHPFDTVGLATLAKAFALSKACLQLIRSGKPNEAFGLSRSLVECTMNLRYLTVDPVLQNGRTRKFVNYARADKAFWLHNALEQFKGRKEEQEVREYARENGLVADSKAARRHWSGEVKSFIWEVATLQHPLDPDLPPSFAHEIIRQFPFPGLRLRAAQPVKRSRSQPPSSM